MLLAQELCLSVVSPWSVADCLILQGWQPGQLAANRSQRGRRAGRGCKDGWEQARRTTRGPRAWRSL